MNKIKVYHVQGYNEYSNWIENIEIVNSLEEADVVLFEGGEDVDPRIYNTLKHEETSSNYKRDLEEQKIYIEAQKLKKHCLGICRGSQFLCALQPDGFLVQHQPNPGTHGMKTITGERILVTSTHHQAQYPYFMNMENYKILGWTTKMLEYHEDGHHEELIISKECEVVYYPKTKCLGIQPHPEMMAYDNVSNIWFRKIFNQFMNNEL